MMVDAEMQKMIDALDNYFEKKAVQLESRFHITKLMSEQYWAEMVEDPEEELPEEEDPADEEPDADDEVEDLDDEVEDLDDELEVPEPPKKGIVKKLGGKLKKPKVKVKGSPKG